jgi:hypothetical protein
LHVVLIVLYHLVLLYQGRSGILDRHLHVLVGEGENEIPSRAKEANLSLSLFSLVLLV